MFKIFNENEKGYKPRNRNSNHEKEVWHCTSRQKKSCDSNKKVIECGLNTCPMSSLSKHKKVSKKPLSKSATINRAFLTPRQHLQLLAEPKRDQLQTLHKPSHSRQSKISTIRTERLTAPRVQKNISMWKDHHGTLPIQKVYNLNCYINTRNYVFNIDEADSLFNIIK